MAQHLCHRRKCAEIFQGGPCSSNHYKYMIFKGLYKITSFKFFHYPANFTCSGTLMLCFITHNPPSLFSAMKTLFCSDATQPLSYFMCFEQDTHKIILEQKDIIQGSVETWYRVLYIVDDASLYHFAQDQRIIPGLLLSVNTYSL